MMDSNSTTNKKVRILFVCLGNICRSPAAEGIMKKLVEKNELQDFIEVDSAGTSGWHEGELPDERMRAHGEKELTTSAALHVSSEKPILTIPFSRSIGDFSALANSSVESAPTMLAWKPHFCNASAVS